jgi:hypothetical protein
MDSSSRSKASLAHQLDLQFSLRLNKKHFSLKGQQREEHSEDTALARRTVHRNNTVVRPNDSQDHRQSQAPSCELGRKKWIEYLPDILDRNPAAGVLQFKTGIGTSL